MGASSDAKRVIGVHSGEYCRGTKWFIKLGANIDRAASPKSVAAPNHLDVSSVRLLSTFFGPRPVPLPFLLAPVKHIGYAVRSLRSRTNCNAALRFSLALSIPPGGMGSVPIASCTSSIKLNSARRSDWLGMPSVWQIRFYLTNPARLI